MGTSLFLMIITGISLLRVLYIEFLGGGLTRMGWIVALISTLLFAFALGVYKHEIILPFIKG